MLCCTFNIFGRWQKQLRSRKGLRRQNKHLVGEVLTNLGEVLAPLWRHNGPICRTGMALKRKLDTNKRRIRRTLAIIFGAIFLKQHRWRELSHGAGPLTSRYVHRHACTASVWATRCFGAACQVASLSAEIFIKQLNGKSGWLLDGQPRVNNWYGVS